MLINLPEIGKRQFCPSSKSSIILMRYILIVLHLRFKTHLRGMSRKSFLFRCLDSNIYIYIYLYIYKCNIVKSRGLFEIKMDNIKVKQEQ